MSINVSVISQKIGLDPLYINYDSKLANVIRDIQKVGYIPGLFTHHWSINEKPGIKIIWLKEDEKGEVMKEEVMKEEVKGEVKEDEKEDEKEEVKEEVKEEKNNEEEYKFENAREVSSKIYKIDNTVKKSNFIFVSAKSRLYKNKRQIDLSDEETITRYCCMVVDLENGIDNSKVCWNSGIFKTFTFKNNTIEIELNRSLKEFYTNKAIKNKEYNKLLGKEGAFELLKAGISRANRINSWINPLHRGIYTNIRKKCRIKMQNS